MDFMPVDRPKWRRKDGQTTSIMLREISDFQSWYDQDIPPRSRKEVLGLFNKKSVFEWVLSSNHLEMEGTLSRETTQEICDHFFSKRIDTPESSKLLDKEGEVTRRTLEALIFLYAYRMDMKAYDDETSTTRYSYNDFLFITESMISEVHVKVLPREKIHSVPPGEYRIYDAYPLGYDEQIYCPPKKIKTKMEAMIDKYNDYVCMLPKPRLYNEIRSDTQSSRSVYNLAAWLLFHFVTIHPFSDGNGRMCRLLANSVLFNECPFPVYLKGPYTFQEARKIYLYCIIECRGSDNKVPALLSAFLIESCLEQWKCFKNMYEKWATNNSQN